MIFKEVYQGENKVNNLSINLIGKEESKRDSVSIKNWNNEEQPRERLMKLGAQSLTTSELVAILIRTGSRKSSAIEVANKLLAKSNNSLRDLSVFSSQELANVLGIGKVKAVTILAALELGKRYITEEDQKREKITNSYEAYLMLKPLLRDLKHEECWVLYFNNAAKLITKKQISKGGLSATVVDIRQIMSLALNYNATSMILAHNHPSGNSAPSPQDKVLTEQLKKAGELLNIRLNDHVIVAGNSYFSFSDERML